MITRVNKNFVLSGEDNIDTLVVKANMMGYPFFTKDNRVYQVKSNSNQTRIKHYDVTDKILVL